MEGGEFFIFNTFVGYKLMHFSETIRVWGHSGGGLARRGWRLAARSCHGHAQ